MTLKIVAFLESWILKLSNLMRHQVVATQNQVRKKQSQSYEEILAD